MCDYYNRNRNNRNKPNKPITEKSIQLNAADGCYMQLALEIEIKIKEKK